MSDKALEKKVNYLSETSSQWSLNLSKPLLVN